MAKKVELEDDYKKYQQMCEQIAQSEAERDFGKAIQQAEATLPVAHSAVTFQRRFLKAEIPAIPSIDCILRYAPAMFLQKPIDAVEVWYSEGSRTERNAIPEIPDRVAAARKALATATSLWSALSAEQTSKVGFDSRSLVPLGIVPVWLSLGLITETKHLDRLEYQKVSDPRRRAQGKCSECGRAATGALSKLLDPQTCPACRRTNQFVITGLKV
jgi:hypothetical protein